MQKHSHHSNFYVITGGPGVGKTTVLNELKKKGYTTVPENAREIIQEQVRNNGEGLPWKNRELYTSLMINAAVESFKSFFSTTDTVFFDRGILDSFCYADMMSLKISDEMKDIAQNLRYNQKVFILPPWPEIYTTDDERKQTWEEALNTFDIMKKTYSGYGYRLIDVPLESVENRVKFITDHL
ncbi:AAA family ATPase [Chryseobacterium populi]|uniref:Putative ATPase n=1 Tax=Chryseobacterium populi TaxID=1144316 RepID=J3CBR5_9FLAO|nr:AAA family ATPase [Chryseobacterium populi]EJL68399.1 putative ATPase [Chryseobacterium populi]